MNETITITIDRAGRVVLPAELRRRLNLRPGSRLLLEVVAQKIELTPDVGAGLNWSSFSRSERACSS